MIYKVRQDMTAYWPCWKGPADRAYTCLCGHPGPTRVWPVLAQESQTFYSSLGETRKDLLKNCWRELKDCQEQWWCDVAEMTGSETYPHSVSQYRLEYECYGVYKQEIYCHVSRALTVTGVK